MKLPLFIIYSLLFAPLSFSIYAEANRDFENTFPLRKPNYRPSLIEYYPEGGMAKVVYVAPSAGEEVPVKEAHFYPSGALKEEVDLIVLPGKGPIQDRLVYHGVAMGYFEKGNLAKVAHYQNGLLEGEVLLYYPLGQPKEKSFYRQGKKEGVFISYFPEGGKKEEGIYKEGKKEGEFVTYYEDGSKASLTHFVRGLPQGKALQWHPQSSQISATSVYHDGLLNGDGKNPAFMAYSPQGELIEVQDFRLGRPQGSHLRYHSQGKVSYRMPYVNGLKEGMEEFFDKKGSSLGGGKFHRGLPIGKHQLLFENGKVAQEALYDAQGHLLEPFTEYHENGKLKKRCTPVALGFEGLYQEWDLEGNLLIEQTYAQGQLTGEEKEFYPGSKPKKRAHYLQGKKAGGYQEWHENGKLKVQATFVEGKREGAFEEWDEEGTRIFTAHYVHGVLHGPLTHYYAKSNDQVQLKESSFFHQGKKEGREEKFYANGKKQSVATFKEGLLEGEYLSYFPNEKVKSAYFFVKGLPEGIQKEFFAPQNDEEPVLARLLNYREGNLEGEQHLYYPNGKEQALVSFSQGLMHGKKKNWDAEGNLFEEGEYVQGKLEGRYYQKNQNNEEAVTYFKEGKKEGLHEVYYPPKEGQKRVKKLDATYVNDLLEGEVSEYDLEGVKSSSAHFSAGKKEGVTTLYAPNGVVLVVIPFHEDKKEGKARFYYPNGQLYQEAEFKNDLRHGSEKFYSESGNLVAAATYCEDKLDGLSQQWDQEGTLLFEGQYVKGLKQGKFQKLDMQNKVTIISQYEKDVLISKQKVDKR